MIKRLSMVLAAMAALAMLIPGSAVALHDIEGGCNGGGTDPADGAYIIDDGEVHKYKLTVPAGTRGYFHVQALNGDIDVYVCDAGTHHCVSTNMYPIPDGCHAAELSDNSSGLELWGFGNSLAPGTYRVYVQHCFSSQDVPDSGQAGACDYGTIAPGGDGALDPLPPIVYAMAFETA